MFIGTMLFNLYWMFDFMSDIVSLTFAACEERMFGWVVATVYSAQCTVLKLYNGRIFPSFSPSLTLRRSRSRRVWKEEEQQKSERKFPNKPIQLHFTCIVALCNVHRYIQWYFIYSTWLGGKKKTAFVRLCVCGVNNRHHHNV